MKHWPAKITREVTDIEDESLKYQAGLHTIPDPEGEHWGDGNNPILVVMLCPDYRQIQCVLSLLSSDCFLGSS